MFLCGRRSNRTVVKNLNRREARPLHESHVDYKNACTVVVDVTSWTFRDPFDSICVKEILVFIVWSTGVGPTIDIVSISVCKISSVAHPVLRSRRSIHRKHCTVCCSCILPNAMEDDVPHKYNTICTTTVETFDTSPSGLCVIKTRQQKQNHNI